MERKRLELEVLEPLLRIPSPIQESHRAVVDRQLPPSWSVDVDTAREEVAWTLQTLSVNALELSLLWVRSNFNSLTLIDVAADEFAGQLPMQAETFRIYQADRTEVGRGVVRGAERPVQGVGAGGLFTLLEYVAHAVMPRGQWVWLNFWAAV